MHTENLVNEAVVRQISVPDYSASPCTILDHILAYLMRDRVIEFKNDEVQFRDDITVFWINHGKVILYGKFPCRIIPPAPVPF